MRVIKKRALRKHGVEGKSSSSNKAVGGVGVKDAEEGEVEAGELKGEEFGGDDGAEEGGEGLEEVRVRVRVRERAWRK